jgi:hypothetical protein
MSSLERTEIIEVETLKPYVPGGIEFVEVTLNKGRIPKAERTLTRRQRKDLKNQSLENSLEMNTAVEIPAVMEIGEPITLGSQLNIDGSTAMESPNQ